MKPMLVMTVEGHEGADHEDVAVGEVDELDDAVDHRVAQRDEGVDATDRERVEELRGERRDGLRRPTSGLPARCRSTLPEVDRADMTRPGSVAPRPRRWSGLGQGAGEPVPRGSGCVGLGAKFSCLSKIQPPLPPSRVGSVL